MTKQDVIAVLKEEAEAVRAFGATSLYLFVDYDLGSKFSLIELVGIKQHLEVRLGLRVDLTTRDSLDPLLRPRIEAMAERVF